MIKSVFKVSWFLICLLGNVYQIGEISSAYFSYQISTTLHVKYPSEFDIPSMGICYHEVQLIKWKELEKLKPNIKEELNLSQNNEEIYKMMKETVIEERRKIQGNIFKGLTLKQGSQVVYNSSDIYLNCLRIKNDGASHWYAPCTYHFDIIPFKYQYYTCYTFDLKLDNYSTLPFLASIRAETTSGFLYFIEATGLMNRTSDAIVFYNNNHEHRRSGYFRNIPISELEKAFVFSYDEYSNYLLEKPNVTNCSKYGSKITNRGSCYESCLRNESIKFFGPNILLPGIFVFDEMIQENPDMVMLTVSELYSNDSMVDIKDKVSQTCGHRCSAPTCNETFYIPKLMARHEYPLPLLVTHVMVSPKIDTTTEPKLSVVVFLTNVFSTIGFWIGLSVYSIIEPVNEFCRKVYKLFVDKIKLSWFEKLDKFEKEKREKRQRKSIVNPRINCEEIESGVWIDAPIKVFEIHQLN